MALIELCEQLIYTNGFIHAKGLCVCVCASLGQLRSRQKQHQHHTHIHTAQHVNTYKNVNNLMPAASFQW